MSIAQTPEPPYTAVIFTSLRTPTGEGYAEHRRAQQTGRSLWYEDYQVRVATVTRAHGMRRG
ncbi:hypothetical protein ACIA03_28825 [Nocardioides sp. NPDC051685]|uniref:hypothetical protein n=1 Tax=Nocardioides sp. NPDC051685 TaxID=3364334 RepID=UPI00379A7FF1